MRSANCQKIDSIVYVGDLVQQTETEMLRTANCGRKSLNEIKEVLQIGLYIGVKRRTFPAVRRITVRWK